MPQHDALLLMLLRFPQELVSADEYAFPDKKPAAYRISAKELDMAESLVKSMVGKWKPDDYHDDFRERLVKVIEDRVKAKGVVRTPSAAETELPRNAATNVVDFMSLLKKSIDAKQRTPAAERVPAKKTAAKKSARKKAAKKSARKAS
jgi:DNA end-binding protein Ku